MNFIARWSLTGRALRMQETQLHQNRSSEGLKRLLYRHSRSLFNLGLTALCVYVLSTDLSLSLAQPTSTSSSAQPDATSPAPSSAQDTDRAQQRETQRLLEALRWIQRENASDDRVLTEALSSMSPAVKVMALETVARLKSSSHVDQILKATRDRDEAVQVAAYGALSQLSNVSINRWLSTPKMISHTAEGALRPMRVVEAIAIAIGERGDPSSDDLLMTLLTKDADVDVLNAAIYGLHRVIDQGEEVAITETELMIGLVQGLPAELRRRTARLLIRLKTHRSKDFIKLIINDPDGQIKAAALSNLPANLSAGEVMSAWVSGDPVLMKAVTSHLVHPLNQPLLDHIFSDFLAKLDPKHSTKIRQVKKSKSPSPKKKRDSMMSKIEKKVSPKVSQQITSLSLPPGLLIDRLSTYQQLLDQLLSQSKVPKGALKYMIKAERVLAKQIKVQRDQVKRDSNASEKSQTSPIQRYLRGISPIDIDHLRCRFSALIDHQRGQPRKLLKCSNLTQLRPLIERLSVQVMLQASRAKHPRTFFKRFSSWMPSTQALALKALMIKGTHKRWIPLVQLALESDDPTVLTLALRWAGQSHKFNLVQEVIDGTVRAQMIQSSEAMVAGINALESLGIIESIPLIERLSDGASPEVIKAAQHAYIKLSKGGMLPMKRRTYSPPKSRSPSTNAVSVSENRELTIETSRGALVYTLSAQETPLGVQALLKEVKKGTYTGLFLSDISSHGGLTFGGRIDDQKKKYNVSVPEPLSLITEWRLSPYLWSHHLTLRPQADGTMTSTLYLTRGEDARAPFKKGGAHFGVLIDGHETLSRLQVGDQILSVNISQ